MKTTIMIITLGMIATGVGMFKIKTTQEQRHLANQYEKALSHQNELNAEWNKLKLEESMLITSVLLDHNIRERMGMVLPKQDSIVYVVEQGNSALVSTNNDNERYVQ